MKPAYTALEDTITERVVCRVCQAQFEVGDAIYRAGGVSCCSKGCARALIVAQSLQDLEKSVHRLNEAMRRAR